MIYRSGDAMMTGVLMKKQVARSEEYLEFVRMLPCCICKEWPSEPHHTESGGVGMKGSDYSAIPLCRPHHRECHDIGKLTFQEKYLDFAELVESTKSKYSFVVEV